MKRPQGYYWVEIHPLYSGMTASRVFVIGLYMQVPGSAICHWFLPGMKERLTDDHFKFISNQALPFPEPNQQSILWTPS